MDKIAPKSDLFQANKDRAAPLLKQLRADGIGHMIGGNIVPSISGETFETKSPVDGTVLASVARGFRSRNAFAVMMTPLMQKPHCMACSSIKAC